MEAILPPDLPVMFTSDWAMSFDGHELDPERLLRQGFRPFPWRIQSDNPWWSRPLKRGEVGCALAHLACWRHAATCTDASLILVLEDDAVLEVDFLERLLGGVRRLRHHRAPFHLLYLGRHPIGLDTPSLDGFVSPGYSHCTFGYLLTRHGLEIILATGLDQSIVPVDEFLPALYVDHPRADVRARYPRRLTALAFSRPFVRQLPKHEAGSDTEDSEFPDER